MSQSTALRSCLRAAEQGAPAWLPDSAAPEEAHAFQAAFLPDPSAVADMRNSTAAFLGRSGLRGSLADSVVLVVSELVTNAIEHGHGEVELEVRVASGTISVSVTDENPAPAVLTEAGPKDLCGRGIALVEAFSDKWGSSGKETWCEFRCDSAGSAA
ncbi:anti-sigma regulatory factor (Ser/Thr protein kinase) [Streptomyces puniciscabiei]|uniref:Anti-sigma regulatory factor (Ser/Thr protein kinase) n=1 Tax=Streptomyces puniciscabiei TaxID=164348 RepID=A0A542UJ44_9ACTN|nr:ATP-binding protein [Streptomyces puniciscabiei]TQK99100.1 anti-sigma regulatory factor (Ser/Thr protein kinase) [Streptomyces puniciscabiei]